MRRSWKAICVALAASLGGYAATAQAQGPGAYYTPGPTPANFVANLPPDAIPPEAGAGGAYYPGAGGAPAGPGVPFAPPGEVYAPGMAPMPPGAGAGMVYYPGASMGPPAPQGEYAEDYGGGRGGYGGHGGGDCGCGNWFVKADALWLQRTRASNTVLATIDDGSGVGIAGLSTDAGDFDPEVGLRLFGGRYTANGLRVEMGYFGLNHYSTSGTVTGAGGDVSVPFSGPGFPGAVIPSGFASMDTVSFSYDSNIHNVEANVARNFFGGDRLWLSNLVGFRYFYLQEEFALTASDALGSSIYRTRTTNNLIGGQIGTEGGFRIGERLSVDVWGKVGVFGNVNSNSSQINDATAGGVIRDVSANGGQLSTVIDLGVNNTFALTRRLSVRGGYDVVIVSGLALAPDQLDFSVTSGSQLTVNDTGSLVFYGPHVGLDYKW